MTFISLLLLPYHPIIAERHDMAWMLIHTCGPRRNEIISRREVLLLAIRIRMKRSNNILALPVAEEIKSPTCGVPYNVWAQPAIECGDASFMARDVTDDSDWAANFGGWRSINWKRGVLSVLLTRWVLFCFYWEEGMKLLPCNLVLTRSNGWRQRVDTIPAVNPATVSTKDGDRPSWAVMNFSSPLPCGCKLASDNAEGLITFFWEVKSLELWG